MPSKRFRPKAVKHMSPAELLTHRAELRAMRRAANKAFAEHGTPKKDTRQALRREKAAQQTAINRRRYANSHAGRAEEAERRYPQMQGHKHMHPQVYARIRNMTVATRQAVANQTLRALLIRQRIDANFDSCDEVDHSAWLHRTVRKLQHRRAKLRAVRNHTKAQWADHVLIELAILQLRNYGSRSMGKLLHSPAKQARDAEAWQQQLAEERVAQGHKEERWPEHWK